MYQLVKNVYKSDVISPNAVMKEKKKLPAVANALHRVLHSSRLMFCSRWSSWAIRQATQVARRALSSTVLMLLMVGSEKGKNGKRMLFHVSFCLLFFSPTFLARCVTFTEAACFTCVVQPT